MNNFNTTLAATETALNSAGSAAKENAAYMESLEAQTNNLKATFQDLANNVIDSELVSSFLTLANEVLKHLNNVVGTTIIQWTLLTGVLTGGLTIWGSVLKSLISFPAAFASIKKAVTAAGVSAGVASVSFSTLLSAILPIAAVIAGIGIAIWGVKKAWDSAHPTLEDTIGSISDLNTQLSDNKTRLSELNQIPYEERSAEVNKEIEELKKENEVLKENIEKKKELASQQWADEEVDVLSSGYEAIVSGMTSTDLEAGTKSELKVYGDTLEEVTQKAEELAKTMVASSYTIGKATKTITKTEAWYSALDAVGSYQDAMREGQEVTEEQIKAYENGAKQLQSFITEIDSLGISIKDLSPELQTLYNNSKLFLGGIKEVSKEVLKTYSEMNGTDAREVIDKLKKMAEEASNLSSMIDHLEGSYNTLSKAQDEMKESGRLSTNSVKALMDSGLDKYLEQTADGYRLTKGALDDYIATQKEQYEVSLNEARTAAINTIQDEDSKAQAYNQTTQEIIAQLEAQMALYGAQARAIARTAPDKGSMYSQMGWLEQNKEYQEAMAIYEESRKALDDLADAQERVANFGSVIGTLKTSASSGKGKTDKTDPLEEEYKKYQELNKATEHYLFLQEKNGASKEKLIELNKGFQEILNNQANTLRDMGADENSEYIRELQNAWWGLQDTIEGIENDITQELRDAFDERLNISENYISDRNSLDDWGSDNEVAAWKRVGAWMDEMYAQGLIDYEYYIQKRNNITKKEAQAEKKAWEEANKAAVQSLSKEVDEWEIAFSYVADKAQDEIDALQKERDSVEEFWDSQIDALKEINDELDKQLERQQLLDDLARAKQKKVMVYKDGRFQYIQDADAVSEAQANLDKYDRDAALQEEVKNLEQFKKEALKSIDDQIEAWEEYRDEWKNVVSDYQKQQDKLIAEQKLGTKLEGENWRNRLDKLADYVNEYKALMQDLANAQNAEYGQTTPTGQPNADRLAQINAQMAANSAAWHNASDAEKKRLEEANKQLAAEKDSIQGAHSTLNPDTGKWETSGGGGSSSGGGKVGSTDSQGHVITGTDGTWGANNPNAPSSSGSGGKGVIGKNPAIYGRASGTLGDSGGIRLVGEKGPELRVLSKGDGVLPADVTRNLWSWGETTPSDVMASLQSMGTATEGITQPIIVENLNLPNVHDGPEFADYMRNNFMRDAVQKAHMR